MAIQYWTLYKTSKQGITDGLISALPTYSAQLRILKVTA